MPDLNIVSIPNLDTKPAVDVLENEGGPAPRSLTDPYWRATEDEQLDVMAVKFVLDSVIDFLEELTLTGEPLRHAGQILRDVEELRKTL